MVYQQNWLGNLGGLLPEIEPNMDESSMSPQQMAINRDLAKALLGTRGNRIQPVGPEPYQATHWTQGVGDMLNVLAGQRLMRGAENRQLGMDRNIAGADVANRVPSQVPGATSLTPSVPGFNPTVPPELIRPNLAPGSGARTNTDPAVQPTRLGGPRQSNISDNYVNRVLMTESGNDPRAVNPKGTRRGGGQFSPTLERRYGITNSNWTDTNVQRDAIRRHAEENRAQFVRRVGREPTEGELYLMHQQGVGGGIALVLNPDRPAVEVLRPFYRRNPRNAINAIRNNLPRGAGDPNTITASQFASQWTNRFGDRQPTVVASREPAPNIPAQDLGSELPNSLEIAQAPNQTLQDVGPATSSGIPTSDQLNVTQVADRQPPLPRDVDNRPVDVERLETLNPNIHLRPERPTPPPADLGLDQNQWMAINRAPAEQREAIIARRRQQFMPVEREIQGGTLWTVPATGQTGFIPKPIEGELIGPNGEKIKTYTIFDRYGRSHTYRLQPRGPANNTPAITPQLNRPQRGSEAQPTEEGYTPTAMPGSEQPQSPESGITPVQFGNQELQNQPFDAQTDNPFRDPLFEDMRRQKLEHEYRQGTDTMRRGYLKEVIDREPEASRTMQLARIVQELENLPGADGVTRGPLGPAYLRLQQAWNGVFGDRHGLSFNTNTIMTAEMLSKMNSMLAGAAAKLLTNRPTQFDFQVYLANNPGLLSSRGGSRFMSQVIESLARTEVELARRAWQLGERGDAINWPRIRDEVYRDNQIVIDGTVINLSRGLTDIRINPDTGEVVPIGNRRGTVTQAADGQYYQYVGRDGVRSEWEARRRDGSPINWRRVDIDRPAQWPLPPTDDERDRGRARNVPPQRPSTSEERLRQPGARNIQIPQ